VFRATDIMVVLSSCSAERSIPQQRFVRLKELPGRARTPTLPDAFDGQVIRMPSSKFGAVLAFR